MGVERLRSPLENGVAPENTPIPLWRQKLRFVMDFLSNAIMANRMETCGLKKKPYVKRHTGVGRRNSLNRVNRAILAPNKTEPRETG